jgi:hypothetical protein
MASRGRQPTQSEAAAAWLTDFLKDGPKPAGNDKDPQPGSVRFESAQAGFSFRTIERVSENVVYKKVNKKTGSIWSLKPEYLTPPKFTGIEEYLKVCRNPLLPN